LGRIAIWALLTVVVATLVGVAALADTGGDQQLNVVGGLSFRDEVEVTVVNIVAYVTDKKGNAVTNLTKEDFRVLQDGQERPLSHFQLYTEELYRHVLPPPSSPAEAEQVAPFEGLQAEALPDLQPSYMAIYIDHQNLRALDRNRVLQQLQSFVRDNCRPPVHMMVASYNRSLKVVQPFTTDSRLIIDALRGMRTMTDGRTDLDDTRSEIFEAMERMKEDPSNKQYDPTHIEGRMNAFIHEEENDLQFTLGALREMVTMISGLPGKKSIFYVSNGLPMVPGIDLYYGMANALDDASMISVSHQYNQYRRFESLVARANAQDVTFYTVDAAGLQMGGIGAAEHATSRDTHSISIGLNNYTDSIKYMAEGTGGVAIVGTNDVRTQLPRVEQDFYTYYSLGYTLHVSGGDRVHKIQVEIPDHPDYEIRYRRRFVEKSLESQVQDTVVTGLMFSLDDNPMAIRIEPGTPKPSTDKQVVVPVAISFPLKNVALLPAGQDYIGQVVLFVASRDAQGRRSDLTRENFEVRIPSSAYDTIKDKDFSISANLLMERNKYRVAVGLFDELTRRASYEIVNIDLEP
jgi:VWFA-related protein